MYHWNYLLLSLFSLRQVKYEFKKITVSYYETEICAISTSYFNGISMFEKNVKSYHVRIKLSAD